MKDLDSIYSYIYIYIPVKSRTYIPQNFFFLFLLLLLLYVQENTIEGYASYNNQQGMEPSIACREYIEDYRRSRDAPHVDQGCHRGKGALGRKREAEAPSHSEDPASAILRRSHRSLPLVPTRTAVSAVYPWCPPPFRYPQRGSPARTPASKKEISLPVLRPVTPLPVTRENTKSSPTDRKETSGACIGCERSSPSAADFESSPVSSIQNATPHEGEKVTPGAFGGTVTHSISPCARDEDVTICDDTPKVSSNPANAIAHLPCPPQSVGLYRLRHSIQHSHLTEKQKTAAQAFAASRTPKKMEEERKAEEAQWREGHPVAVVSWDITKRVLPPLRAMVFPTATSTVGEPVQSEKTATGTAIQDEAMPEASSLPPPSTGTLQARETVGHVPAKSITSTPSCASMGVRIMKEEKEKAQRQPTQAEIGSPLDWPNMPVMHYDDSYLHRFAKNDVGGGYVGGHHYTALSRASSPSYSSPSSMHHRRWYFLGSALRNPFRPPRLMDMWGGRDFHFRRWYHPVWAGTALALPHRAASTDWMNEHTGGGRHHHHKEEKKVHGERQPSSPSSPWTPLKSCDGWKARREQVYRDGVQMETREGYKGLSSSSSMHVITALVPVNTATPIVQQLRRKLTTLHAEVEREEEEKRTYCPRRKLKACGKPLPPSQLSLPKKEPPIGHDRHDEDVPSSVLRVGGAEEGTPAFTDSVEEEEAQSEREGRECIQKDFFYDLVAFPLPSAVVNLHRLQEQNRKKAEAERSLSPCQHYYHHEDYTSLQRDVRQRPTTPLHLQASPCAPSTTPPWECGVAEDSADGESETPSLSSSREPSFCTYLQERKALISFQDLPFVSSRIVNLQRLRERNKMLEQFPSCKKQKVGI